jgi:polyisoprenoid-binding protein YceI
MATFNIDPAHTDVLFSAKHMMVTTVRGTFTELSGTIDLNETDPTASKAELNVKAASLDTGFGARDTHLRSDDFFGVETYPEIRVVSTAIRPKGGNQYVVTADVTIRDITKPVDFDVEFLGFFPGMDGARHAGFTATAKVNRKDWNLNWNVALETGGWLVGDTIKLEVEVAVVEAIAVAA